MVERCRPEVTRQPAGRAPSQTAYVLAAAGAFGDVGESLVMTFEEAAGPVSITIRGTGRRIASCELRAPRPMSFGPTVPAALVARAQKAGGVVTATWTFDSMTPAPATHT